MPHVTCTFDPRETTLEGMPEWPEKPMQSRVSRIGSPITNCPSTHRGTNNSRSLRLRQIRFGSLAVRRMRTKTGGPSSVFCPEKFSMSIPPDAPGTS